MITQKRAIARILCIIVCYSSSVSYSLEPETLFSEATAELFIKQASRIHQQDPLDPLRTQQAILFLEAASSLDFSLGRIPENILRIGADSSGESSDYSGYIIWALEKYIDQKSDLEVASNAVWSVMDRLNSRVEREALLNTLFRKYASVNDAFSSELATQLGLLAVEKADIRSAMNYFGSAYSANPYNQLAFSKFYELAGTQGVPLEPSIQPIHVRRTIEINPYDLSSAIRYADTLRKLQMYDLAAGVYEYIEQVHQFLYPNEPLPDEILQGWLLSCYYGQRLQTKALGLTEKYRDPNRFNLILEAVAYKTLLKLGRIEKGRERLESIEQKAQAFVSDSNPSGIYPEDLAWFYSFVFEDSEKSLAWSNRSLVADPNRQGVKPIFAYSLVQNGQDDLAKQYAEPLKETDQIAALVMATIQLSAEDKQPALDALRAVFEMSPDSFVAEKAIRLLKEQGSDYIPPAEFQTIRENLSSQYNGRIVPDFITPSNRFSAKLLFNGSDFLYGADLSGRFVIENKSDESLIIADGGLIQGYLRVDAELQGSLNLKIPNLISMRFRPSKPILPGDHFSVSLDLNCGRLERLLMTYPQADVQIRFTVYLDPVISDSGELKNGMKGVEPVQVTIHRKGVLLTQDFLLQRLDVLAKGQSGQKYRASALFTGLLAERTALAISGADFKHTPVDRTLLVDSVRKLLVDDDWKIRVHTLSCLLSLSVPLDGMIKEVSENLNHDKWPVRMLAMDLLSQAQPEAFQKVLDWAAEHDPYELNRRMAIALGGREPEAMSDKTQPEFSK